MSQSIRFTLLAGLTLGCVATAQNHPTFTHSRSIPADADPSSIHFERIKAVTVLTNVVYHTGVPDGPEQQFRDPGGSMHWSAMKSATRVPAYEVTYSYRGDLLSSDETGNRYATFSVYFHPEELPSELLSMLSSHTKANKATLAAYFKLSASRALSSAAIVDPASSKLCEGNFVDGSWVRNDEQCRDQIRVTAQTVPSDSITLSIQPISPTPASASVSGRH